MKLFEVDNHTKRMTKVSADPTEVPLVFAIDFQRLATGNGTARTCLHLAFHIAESQAVKPLFIDNDQSTVEAFLHKAPQSLLVSINQQFSSAWLSARRDRLLTIGANDYYRDEYAPCADIVLSPCFNPVRFDRAAASDCPAEQVRIDYTCPPSRMKPDIGKLHSLPGQLSEQKIIAAYIRAPDHRPLSDLLSEFKRLYEKYKCRFLVSTGFATFPNQAGRIEACLSQLPGSEFFNFRSPKTFVNPFEDFFRRADAIVVTDDSVSGLSDAVASGNRVFLHTIPSRARDLASDRYHSSDQPFRLQQALIRQDRLKLFMEQNLMSDWRPVYVDEWKKIAETITGVMQERKQVLQTLPQTLLARPLL
jgi:hypothetical protein